MEHSPNRMFDPGLLTAGICLVLFLLLALANSNETTLPYDEVVRTAIHGWASAGLTAFVRAVSLLGSVAVIVMLSLSAAAALYLSGRGRAAIFLVLTMATVMALNSVLKLVFHQARPAPYFGDVLDSYSFPSGHAAYSCCFYLTIAGIAATFIGKPLLRSALFGIAAILIGAVGFSRIYLGLHQPSDVLGGYLVAVFVMSGARAASDHAIRRGKKIEHS